MINHVWIEYFEMARFSLKQLLSCFYSTMYNNGVKLYFHMFQIMNLYR